MQSEIPDDVMETAKAVVDRINFTVVDPASVIADVAEALLAERKAALSDPAEHIGFLIPRGEVAGPDNEYYSFCEDKGSAAAEADIYDNGYFPIYAAPPALTAQVQDVAPVGQVDASYGNEGMLVACFTPNTLPVGTKLFTAPPAPIQSVAIPEGWQLVPKEPTEAMHNAARDWSVKKYGVGVGAEGSDGCYRAMLAAAPAKQEDTPLQKKVAEELKPLREAIENSTGKWERP